MAVLLLLIGASAQDRFHIGDRPPNQTAAQASLMKDWQSRAEKLSGQLAPSVISYLESAEVKNDLKDIDALYKMSGKELLDYFVYSVRRIPLIVTFSITNWDNIVNAGHLFNKWQLRLQGVQIPHNQLVLADYTERTLANFPAIANLDSPTADEAYTRPLYFAINLWKKANGNPMYGDTNFVVYPERHNFCLLAPSDTGWWYKACVLKQPTTPPVDCTKYHQTDAMGTYLHMDHLVLTHNQFYQYPISQLFRRFYNDTKQKVPNNGQNNWYYECDMAAAFWVPEHVWYTILDFTKLWGQAGAEKLQQWHIDKHRPLTWSGDLDHMILDAKVQVAKGMNWTTKHKDEFEDAWKTYKTTDWDTVFKKMPGSLHFYFLRDNDCGGKECGPHCMYMGTNADRECIYTGYK